jgi:hypothetical protein
MRFTPLARTSSNTERDAEVVRAVWSASEHPDRGLHPNAR